MTGSGDSFFDQGPELEWPEHRFGRDMFHRDLFGRDLVIGIGLLLLAACGLALVFAVILMIL